jgi:hypothetical protein
MSGLGRSKSDSNPFFRGGSTGGRDAEAVIPVSPSTGDFDFDLNAAVPLARRSHDGFVFVKGLLGRSAIER